MSYAEITRQSPALRQRFERLNARAEFLRRNPIQLMQEGEALGNDVRQFGADVLAALESAEHLRDEAIAVAGDLANATIERGRAVNG